MKFRIRVLLPALLLSAVPTASPACSMCYSSAKATSVDGQRAITRGAAILLFPPLAFLTLGSVFAFRYTKARDAEQSEPP